MRHSSCIPVKPSDGSPLSRLLKLFIISSSPKKFEKQRIQTIRFGFYTDGYTLTDGLTVKHGHHISLDNAENVAVFNPINKTTGGRLKATRFEFGFK